MPQEITCGDSRDREESIDQEAMNNKVESVSLDARRFEEHLPLLSEAAAIV